MAMATSIARSSTVPSLPPPSPKSPPEYPDLYGKRREMARVQMLEREISYLEEELKSVQGLQPASRCCKEIAEFVLANSDPLLPTTKKNRRSCRFWKWLCRLPCFTLSWICCCSCHECCASLELPRCCCGSRDGKPGTCGSRDGKPGTFAPYQDGTVALVLNQIAANAIAQVVVVSQIVAFSGVLLVHSPLAALANAYHAAVLAVAVQR
ncbi:hypothetical protein L6164_013871 [Bauhinia variegata]|uniref:Uncharacterized protein n=1 Tax=Bauhinia variegata TaxID=167791 RepID=A0ACB9NGT5_BAUVA|nr:hypothetical protein L6164_013871 [Bauhinia variegata]